MLEERTLLSNVFTVTDTTDSPGDTGSLRYALSNAQDGDTVDFNIPMTDPGYNATTDSWTISPATALPSVSASISIDGSSQPGYVTGSAPVIVLDANSAFGVLQVNGGVTASLTALTITGGSTTDGGGINNAGNLTVSDSTISADTASEGGACSTRAT
jgi:hypothetical protein